MKDRVVIIETTNDKRYEGLLISKEKKCYNIEVGGKIKKIKNKKIKSVETIKPFCKVCFGRINLSDNFCRNCGGKLGSFTAITGIKRKEKGVNKVRNEKSAGAEKISDNFTQFIPEIFIERMLSENDFLNKSKEINGTVLFADISGFTKLSEKLLEEGNEGTEELTIILNRYFTEMIFIIESYNGHVIKFGGDSITIIFAGERESVLYAVKCSLEMQEAMRSFRQIDFNIGTFGIRMKIGINFGRIILNIIGNEIRKEYIVDGEALQDACRIENLANPGEIVIGDKGYLLVKDAVSVYEEIDNNHVISSLIKEVSKNSDIKIKKNDYQGLKEKLIPFLPKKINKYGEHKKVTTIFVNYKSDIDTHSFFCSLMDIAEQYDGYINKVDINDKGKTVIILFGIDKSHDNNFERAVKCVMEIRKLYPGIKAGVNSGYVYCGLIGSDARKEFSIIGMSINFAARIMQTAQYGEILVSERSKESIENTFAIEEKGIFTLKGIKGQVKLYSVLKEKPKKDVFSKIVLFKDKKLYGREKEISLLENLIIKVENNNGQVVGIRGDAGVGKSHLLATLLNIWQNKGYSGCAGECLYYGKSIAFVPIVDILERLFEIGDDNDEIKKQKINDFCFEVMADKVNFFPLFYQYMGIKDDGNEFIKQMAAKDKIDNLQFMILDLISYKSRKKPFLIIIEDLHWIDSDSLNILQFLIRNIENEAVLILLLYRNEIDIKEFLQYRHFTEIILENLQTTNARGIIENILLSRNIKIDMVEKESIDTILNHSEGNPLFIEEIISYLIDTGNLRRENHNLYKISGNIEIPGTIANTILVRIENLSEMEKEILKIASVIGRQYDLDILKHIYMDKMDEIKILQLLRTIEQNNLIRLIDEKLSVYIFKHDSIQKSIYEMMSFTQRREIHKQIALFIEENYKDNIDNYFSTLAFHYELSQNIEKQIYYYEKSGDKARVQGQNNIALQNYKKLLKYPQTEKLNKERVFVKINEVYESLGDFESIIVNADEGLELFNDSADLLCQKLMALTHLGKKDDAMAIIEQYKNDTKNNIKLIYHIGYTLRYIATIKEAETFLEKYLHYVDEETADIKEDYYVLLFIIYWFLYDKDKFFKLLNKIEDMIEHSESVKNKIYFYHVMAFFYKREDWITIPEDKNRQEMIFICEEKSAKLAKEYGFLMLFNEQNAYAQFQKAFYKKDFIGVIPLLEEHIDYFKKINEIPIRGRLISYLAKCYCYIEQWQKSNELYLSAIEMRRKIGDQAGLIDDYSDYVYNLIHQGNIEGYSSILEDIDNCRKLLKDERYIVSYPVYNILAKKYSDAKDGVEKWWNSFPDKNDKWSKVSIYYYYKALCELFSSTSDVDRIKGEIAVIEDEYKNETEEWFKLRLSLRFCQIGTLIALDRTDNHLDRFEVLSDKLLFDDFSRFILPKYYRGIIKRNALLLNEVLSYFDKNGLERRSERIRYFIDCINSGEKVKIESTDLLSNSTTVF